MQVGPTGGAAESLAAIQQKAQAENGQSQATSQQLETPAQEQSSANKPQGNSGNYINTSA